MKKKGFSLLELMVVMTLIAIITAASVAGLISLRNATVTDRASNDTLDAIRDVQTNSISVMKEANQPTLPVVWGLKFDSGAKTVERFFLNNVSGSLVYVPSSIDTTSSVGSVESMTISEGANTLSSIYIYYSTPFAKYYASNGTDCISGGDCDWIISSDVPNDAVLTFTDENLNLSNKDITITFDYKNNVKKVHIRQNGDSYVE